MAKDYGMRGEAAMRLKGGKKGAPPPEEDLGLPPEDEMPPEEGGAPPDLASLLGGAMPGEMPAEEGALPPQAPMPGEEGMPGEGEMEPPQPPDLETALGGVETALEGLPPESAEEIRTHLNAIREIAASGGAGAMPMGEPPPMEGATPMPDGGAGAMGMMEPQV